MPPEPSLDSLLRRHAGKTVRGAFIANGLAPGRRHFATPPIETERGHKTPEGAIVGAAIGGIVSAILAAASALEATLTLPALGIVIASPWIAALAGASAGVASGALLGAMVGYAMVEDRVVLPHPTYREAPAIQD